ncbi:hypothetical protein BKA62DRAFT_800909 [Auriculariales sp. MPI-PUGE-AT-0066]|nr:hypothetical protein BKA62DRAFT_800909 [Auriculariales sp. MPI-PUGE-AT-0066]
MDIPFSHFVDLINALSRISPIPAKDMAKAHHGPNKAHTLLERWIRSVQQHQDVTGLQKLGPGNALSFFRLLFPEDDRRRYGIQESTLAELLADTLSVSPLGRGASLRNWAHRDFGKTGCLGHGLQKLLQPMRTKTNSQEQLSLKDVDNLLSELAMLSPFSQLDILVPSKPTRTRKEIVRHLYRNLSPSEAAVVTQVILRDLRPVLYPATFQLHSVTALTGFNSRSYNVFTKWQVMRLWDCLLPAAYRARGAFEEACAAWDSRTLPEACSPSLGINIEIPKSVKATSPEHVVKLFHGSQHVYAETKYDGERMQIHVDFTRPSDEQIIIFSKSKRVSTNDRHATLFIIRDALQYSGFKSAILEAEMVAYSGELRRIDEFWRIRSLIEKTAKGVRSWVKPSSPSKDTQNSMISDASGNGTRWLGVVFFDLLMVDGISALDDPYNERRRRMESVLTLRSGYSMLAERIQLDMESSNAADQVQAVFIRRCSEYEEGLIFKASDGMYNDPSSPWVKLKKDYIPGLGDCIDLVIVGASWDKDRGRILGVGPRTYTTLWLACLNNSETETGVTVLFTSSYGLDRKNLEMLNFIIGAQEPVEWNKAKPEASISLVKYSIEFACGAPRPDVLLGTPILAEVVGAGFTKARGSKYYELRFPRITKFHRQSERPWTAATYLDEYNDIARTCVGKDGKNKQINDDVNCMWGIDSSPTVRTDLKRRTREEDLSERLQSSSATKRRNTMTSSITDFNQLFEALQAATPQSACPAGSPDAPASAQAMEPGAKADERHSPSHLLPTPPLSSQPIVQLPTQVMGPAILPRSIADFETARAFLAPCFATIIEPPGSELAKRARTSRPRSHLLFAQGRLLHSVQALLVAIDWISQIGPAAYIDARPAERGIVFIDATDVELCNELIDALLKLKPANGTEMLVLDVRILSWNVLPNFIQQLESRVIWSSAT